MGFISSFLQKKHYKTQAKSIQSSLLVERYASLSRGNSPISGKPISVGHYTNIFSFKRKYDKLVPVGAVGLKISNDSIKLQGG